MSATRPPCFECSLPSDHDHHVVPRSKGGTRTVPLCAVCHAKVHGLKTMWSSELTKAALARAKTLGRVAGRRPKLDERKQVLATALYESREHSVEDICHAVGCSRSTLFAYVRATRGSRAMTSEPEPEPEPETEPRPHGSAVCPWCESLAEVTSEAVGPGLTGWVLDCAWCGEVRVTRAGDAFTAHRVEPPATMTYTTRT
jgi:transposase-like protein